MDLIDFTQEWSHGKLKLVFPEEDENNAAEGRVLYANQSTLEMWSPVFEAMFREGSFREGATREVRLPGKDYDDVLELLRVLHPPNHPVTLENAYRLVHLAHEYQMQGIVNRCEEAILKDEPKISTLKVADDYDLQKLRQHCIDHVGTSLSLADAKRDKHFNPLCEESKVDLLSKIIQSMEAKTSTMQAQISSLRAKLRTTKRSLESLRCTVYRPNPANYDYYGECTCKYCTRDMGKIISRCAEQLNYP